jgi:heme exporter protein A
LEAEGLIKRFRGVAVLKGVDLRISAGEIVVLYGPNGSGKTTLLRILATLSRPHAGGFKIDGRSGEDRDLIRPLFSYSGHGTQLYDDMNPIENLHFFTALFQKKPTDVAIRNALEQVGLWRFRTFAVATFSAGMKRRLSLARTMLLTPRLLLLDEPYTSLDSAGIALVNDYVARFAAEGGSVLLSSHSPELVAVLKHRPVWLIDGKLSPEAPAHVV